MPTSCQAFGLCLQSDFAVPGSLPNTPSLPDITITEGHAALTRRDRTLGAFTVGPEGLLFEHPTANFICNPTSIIVQPRPHAAPADISTYLIATALPASLWMRGDALLHAAAVVLPGATKAIAIVGTSGSGKSTLLNAFLQQGCSIVAEDSVCIRISSPAITASGLPTRLFLRAENTTREAFRQAIDVPPTSTLQSAPLGAIIILNNAPEHDSPQRLAQPEALTQLLRHTHRPNIPALLNQQPALLARWSSIARTFPIYSWSPLQISAHSPFQGLSDLSGIQGQM